MKNKLKPIIATLLVISISFSANSQNHATTIKVQAMDMATALMKNDFTTFSKYMHPNVVAFAGGKENMKLKMDSAYAAMKLFGVAFKRYWIGNPGEIIKYKDQLQAILPESTVVKTPLGELTAETSMIVISTDNGKHWYFIDTNVYKVDRLKNILPDTALTNNTEPNPKISTAPVSAASGGYLARPSNIYAESQAEVFTSTRSAEEPVPAPVAKQDEAVPHDMQLVVRDDIPAADEPLAHQAQPPLTTDAEDPALQDEAEEQKRRAAERLHKLRNLSFNVNSADPNNEFENVPAYIRRNMELYGNSFSAVENFYSNYEVKKDENNNTQISTINTFLDGNKPD